MLNSIDNGLVNPDKGNQFKTLEFPFDKNGFHHELINRSGLVCLVRSTRIGFSNIPAHFEVVTLRQLPAWVHPATGAQIPPKEVYPDAERWGDVGFTYTTMDAALARFDSLAHIQRHSAVQGLGAIIILPGMKTRRQSRMWRWQRESRTNETSLGR